MSDSDDTHPWVASVSVHHERAMKCCDAALAAKRENDETGYALHLVEALKAESAAVHRAYAVNVSEVTKVTLVKSALAMAAEIALAYTNAMKEP